MVLTDHKWNAPFFTMAQDILEQWFQCAFSIKNLTTFFIFPLLLLLLTTSKVKADQISEFKTDGWDYQRASPPTIPPEENSQIK